MRIDNCSYKPISRGLNINEATIKYIAENVPTKDLPQIASAFELFQNSCRTFSFDSSIGQLVAQVSEKTHAGRLELYTFYEGCKYDSPRLKDAKHPFPVKHIVRDNLSITTLISYCLTLFEDISFVQEKTRRNIENTEDYTPRFVEYIKNYFKT